MNLKPFAVSIVILLSAICCNAAVPENEKELKKEIKKISKAYTPYLKSHPKPLTFRERTEIKDHWKFTFEIKDAIAHFGKKGPFEIPEAPTWETPDLDVRKWEDVDVPQWRYLLEKKGSVTEPKANTKRHKGGNHSSISWYRTEFTADPEESGTRTWLCFDGVDWLAEVYLNGKKLGSHKTYYEAFRFDVTDVIQTNNTLAVRIVDGKGFGEPHAFWSPLPDARANDQVYTRNRETSLNGIVPLGYHKGNGFGILREVYLETTGSVRTDHIFVRNNLSGDGARIKLELEADHAQTSTLHIELLPENFRGKKYAQTVSVDLEKGLNVKELMVPMPSAKIWTPETPYLYRCRITLKNGKTVLDQKDQLFGCRSFSIVSGKNPMKGFAHGMPLLNGKPTYLRGTSVQGMNNYQYWGQQEKLLNAMYMIKAANFNAIRVCQHVQFPEVRELLDRLGIMSVQEQGSWFRDETYKLNPKMKRWQELVKTGEKLARTCYNNPGVVMLTFANETNFDPSDIVREVLKADPDRIVRPISGRNVSRVKDVEYARPHKMDADLLDQVIDDVHYYYGWYYKRLVQPWDEAKLWPAEDRLVTVGEYGGEAQDSYETMRDSYPDYVKPPAPETETLWGSAQVAQHSDEQIYGFMGNDPKTLAENIEASQNYVEALTSDKTIGYRISTDAISGYFQFYFMDATVCFWPKSMVSFDQRPKKSYYQMAQISQPLVPLPQLQGEKPDTMQVWVANDLPTTHNDACVEWQVSHEGKIVLTGSQKINVAAYKATPGNRVDLTGVSDQYPTFDLVLTLKDADGKTLSTFKRKVICKPKQFWEKDSDKEIDNPFLRN